MAISEACKYEIHEEVNKMVKDEGINKFEAFRRMADFFKSIGIELKESTVRGKYYRAEEVVTNVTKESQHTENIQNSIPEIIKDRHSQGGGKREGAGRPQKELQEQEVTLPWALATGAIVFLKKIKKDDPERDEQLTRVLNWILENRKRG